MRAFKMKIEQYENILLNSSILAQTAPQFFQDGADIGGTPEEGGSQPVQRAHLSSTERPQSLCQQVMTM